VKTVPVAGAISESDVLYEDNHLIAIQKKAGQLVQGDHTGDANLGDLVKDFLKQKYGKPGNVYLGTLHRLDRPVWGLVLFAKTSKAAERMSKAFQKGLVRKRYLAMLDHIPSVQSGVIESYLSKDGRSNIVRSYKKPQDGAKRAETHFRVLFSQANLIELSPVTGRSHQLRVHCAQELKCPIKGDVKYKSKTSTTNRSLYLLSYQMDFQHPVTKGLIHLQARIPEYGEWKKVAGFSAP